MNMLRRLGKSEKAQGLVEYGLILALVSVIAVGALGGAGGKVKATFEQVITDSGIVDGSVPEPEPEPETEPEPEENKDYLWVVHNSGYEVDSQEGKGYYSYIGDELEVYIPHEINGDPIASYFQMFQGTNVEKVVSDNPNITDTMKMFNNSTAKRLDVSLLNTSSVTSMRHMFDGALADKIELGDFDTSMVSDMAWMFQGSAAKSLDLSSFDVSNMGMEDGKRTFGFFGMFQSASATTLDLSSWDTRKLDTSNLTVGAMFNRDLSSTVYARSNTDINWFRANVNTTSNIRFIVK